MISRGITHGDSNKAQKKYSQTECMVVRASKVELGPIIGFGPDDLEGVTTPHNDALVIQATIVNFDVTRVFVDVGSSVNVLF